MPNTWDQPYRGQNLTTIAQIRVGEKLAVTGTSTFERQAAGRWTSLARTFSRNKAAAYYLPIYKVFQETIIAGFAANPTGISVPWVLLHQALGGLRNLALTYANQPVKRQHVDRLVEDVARLLDLQRNDNLPMYIIHSGAPYLHFQPNLIELRALVEPVGLTLVERDGCPVYDQFLADVDRIDISFEGERVQERNCIPFLLEKMGGDRVALRELSRVMHQGGLITGGPMLTVYTNAANQHHGGLRPLFWTATGYGIFLQFTGTSRVKIWCRKNSAGVEELDIYLTQSIVGTANDYYDPAAQNLIPGTPMTQSPLQGLTFQLRARLLRRGASFALEIDDASFDVRSRPATGQHIDTPDWMFNVEEAA
jgi:hypothetical protein